MPGVAEYLAERPPLDPIASRVMIQNLKSQAKASASEEKEESELREQAN